MISNLKKKARRFSKRGLVKIKSFNNIKKGGDEK